jgi:hypothetical protein
MPCSASRSLLQGRVSICQPASEKPVSTLHMFLCHAEIIWALHYSGVGSRVGRAEVLQ